MSATASLMDVVCSGGARGRRVHRVVEGGRGEGGRGKGMVEGGRWEGGEMGGEGSGRWEWVKLGEVRQAEREGGGKGR